jgi:hypothetical protein
MQLALFLSDTDNDAAPTEVGKPENVFSKLRLLRPFPLEVDLIGFSEVLPEQFTKPLP